MTVLALFLTAVVAYFLGRAHGWMAAIRHISSLVPIEPDHFVDTQRDQAPWQ